MTTRAGGRTRQTTAQLPLWEASGTEAAVSVAAIDAARPRPPAPVRRTEFVVLASSSGGNCSALIRGEGRLRRATLIDAGLSPRRTRRELLALGLDLDRVDEVVFTHLDTDHCHPGWAAALPSHARFRIFRGHRARARRAGLLRRRTLVFDDAFEPAEGVRASAAIAAHDAHGAAVFRFEFDAPGGAASLGYATDLGRVTPEIVAALRGVDTLAIESNYCPEMQRASDRPEFLKRRIMDGGGHLSNQECADAVREIAPRREVVLLHLSRQCNRPEIALGPHAGAPYRVTAASHDRPTGVITLVG